jgi:hypothetical protein
MSNDFDVVTGDGAPRPPKIKPSAPPTPEMRRSGATDKMAPLPKDPASAK